MSIKDYKKGFIVTNGNTNEVIKVPFLNDIDDCIITEISVQDLVLLRTITKELDDCEHVLISKTYMKD